MNKIKIKQSEDDSDEEYILMWNDLENSIKNLNLSKQLGQ